ncbi:unnamed protein product [Didymodactylos carnosus]|uniref:D-3-phosphoglycerate dehydrogenase n=1 Tax=Didymodactylos carnosus TaxID=1234261 RepID=A0A814PEK4_9BILA|nr:unnamed protein product [Didymodactylos carnosus]CAF1460654.1 unnamed protein product [Didymodactylos carnosus]CAF3871442.1 unnamed protein product [Didymodactylos carnosus]CAF4254039.1 unnamed protein product [Didymodactylos carnosus]
MWRCGAGCIRRGIAYQIDEIRISMFFVIFVKEPPKDFTLIKHENVIATPHLGANTKEAQKRVAIELAEQIRDFKMGTSLIGVINGSAVMGQFSNTNRSLLVLSRSFGELLIRINKHEDISSPITISCHNKKAFLFFSYLFNSHST